MAERAVQFRSPTEVETARQKLDRTADIPLEQFASLVGPFTFKEQDKVCCQLVKDGSRCEQPHWHGWVAKRKDDVEGYIGRICAQRNFGADDRFSSEVARVNREMRIDELVVRIKGRLDDPQYRDRLRAAIERQRQLRDEMARLHDLWPKSLLVRLAEIENTYHLVPIEVRYVEKDENGRDQYTYQPSDLGAVAGVDAMDLSHARDIGNRLREARTAVEDAKPSNQQPERTLRAWAESLDQLDRCEAELEDAFAEIRAFTTPENLQLLCWLVRRHDDQDEIVQAILELVSGKRATKADAAAAIRQWRGEIQAANGGRDFRVP